MKSEKESHNEHLVKSEKITTNLTSPCFISVTLGTCFFGIFESFMMKKIRYKYCNKQITNRDHGNVQSHDQEESKFDSTINANSGAHTLTHNKIIKSPFNKINVFKTNKVLKKILLLEPVK